MGPDVVWAGPAGSESVAWKPEVLVRAVTVAPGDGEHPLVLDELAPRCPRHHG